MVMSRVGSASARKLRRLAAIPLATAAALAVAACGGGAHADKTAAAKVSPAKLLSQSFSASDALNSGHVALTLDLRLDGVKQLDGKPIALSVSGPFQRTGGELDTDLVATVSAGSSSADLALDKVGKDTYVELAGTFYKLPTAGASGATGVTGVSGLLGATGARGVLGGLGIDPASWLSDPRDVGEKTVGGVVTEHVQAQINIANVLNDVSKMIGGATGANGASTSTSVLALLQSAITTAQVDIYTGVADHIVREFDLDIAFTVPAIAAGVLDGLTGGSLTLDATLTALGQSQTVTAPANAQPSSKLLNGVFALESKFGSLAAVVAGLTGSNGSAKNFGGLLSGAGANTSS
jgi:hypothetical protein